jgi:hypothetical protein
MARMRGFYRAAHAENTNADEVRPHRRSHERNRKRARRARSEARSAERSG